MKKIIKSSNAKDDYIKLFRKKWCIVILESQITPDQLSDVSISLKKLMDLGLKFQLVVNHNDLLRKFWKRYGSWDDTSLDISEALDEGIALRSALQISHSLSHHGIRSQLVTDIHADEQGIDGFSNIFIDEDRLNLLMDRGIIPIMIPIFLDKKNKKTKCIDSINFAKEVADVSDADKLIVVSTSCNGLSFDKSAISHLSTDEAITLSSSTKIPYEIKKYVKNIVEFVNCDSTHRRGHIVGVGNNDLINEILTVDGVGTMITNHVYNIPGEKPYSSNILFRDHNKKKDMNT